MHGHVHSLCEALAIMAVTAVMAMDLAIMAMPMSILALPCPWVRAARLGIFPLES